MRFFLFLAILIGFGCATAMPKFPADQSFVDFPAAGNLERVTSARVGDSVVEKAKFFKRPAKLLSSEILDEHTVIGTVTLGPGKYKALYQLKEWTFYEPTAGVFSKGPGEFMGNAYGLLASDDGRYATGYALSGATGFVRHSYLEPEDIVLISDTTHVDVQLPSIKQELVYNGRAESIIRFMYREYKNDMARPAFTQNLVYDLDQGSRVVFQSVELDVVDATNTEIRYKLLSGFPNYE
ncbi:MAG TPA: hypothetical protein DCW39_02030 [Betaproteobacteria bacterium]|nr:hypothetical protein [Betaproteobacteria bacterium]